MLKQSRKALHKNPSVYLNLAKDSPNMTSFTFFHRAKLPGISLVNLPNSTPTEISASRIKTSMFTGKLIISSRFNNA